MSEIRKALRCALLSAYWQGMANGSAHDASDESAEKGVTPLLEKALALLPPEGETRGEQCPKCGPIGCAECYGTGRLSGYQAHANTGEPAPSSEKALGEALRLLERWYTWQAEATEVRMADDDYLNIVTPTAAILASSPAPEEVKL